MLIYPTVVIGLEAVYARTYGELIALVDGGFHRLRRVLAAGRMACRSLEPAQHDGAVLVRLRRFADRGGRLRPNLIVLAVALFGSACSPRSIIRSAWRC